MQDLVHIAPQPRRRAASRGALVALLAGTVLVGSVAPTLALSDAPGLAFASAQERPMTSSSFRRHFYRGQQQTYGDGGSAHRQGAGAASPQAMEALVSYCAGHFKSYDLSTGTYLGYDGNARACP